MATYVDGSSMLAHQASEEEIHDLMLKKAHELFAVCDKETKGFITKRDMQRLQQELPLSPQQLEDVFDSLDDDGNGFLTLEEFSEGFGGFIGLGPPGVEKQTSMESGGSEAVYENEHGADSADEEQHFQDMIDTIGVHTVLDDADTLRALWSRLRTEDGELLGQFESFLGRVTTELKRTHQEHLTLEGVLRNKSSAHDDEVQKLYEEMENQIKAEKDRILAEERSKERQLREELERNIYEKDRQLQELQQHHSEVQQKLGVLNSTEVETKQENERLGKEKSDMEEILIQSQHNLDDSKAYITQLRQQYRTEKKERAMAALQVSEGIALERESLVKQLEMLREMNKKLRDDRDEADLRRGGDTLHQELGDSETAYNGEQRESAAAGTRQPDEADGAPVLDELAQRRRRQQSLDKHSVRNSRGASLEKQGSILANYFGPASGRTPSVIESDDDIECDEPVPLTNGYTDNAVSETHLTHRDHFSRSERGAGVPPTVAEDPLAIDTQLLANRNAELLSLAAGANLTQQEYLQGIDRGEFPPLSGEDPHRVQRGGFSDHSTAHRATQSSRSSQSSAQGHQRQSEHGAVHTARRKDRNQTMIGSDARDTDGAVGDFDIQSPRGVPVGAYSSSDPTEYNLTQQEIENASPERLFKVVFVGDSGVGKSSFIHQFCSKTFKGTFSATIGVDFQVKNLRVDGKIIALQLWDTAGQERFRSITKQYFRKADGVLIMYDVTSELSYKNVRNWMTSVQEGTEDNTVLTIIGNKLDLVEDQDHRVVTTKDGAKLADEFGSLFYETSAKSGLNVAEAIQGMASLLREREDHQLQKALNLSEAVAEKKPCCG